jgi:glutathione peroxidase
MLDFLSSNKIIPSKESLYEIKINASNGTRMDLENYRGKYILFVNVASKCGFTPQYKELEELYQKYKEILVIIGLPCNQFGNQEPGTNKEISSFCEINYDITFPITEKLEVKGKDTHEIYKWLTQASRNGSTSSKVRWNFQKYLINKEGYLLDFFYSTTSPSSKKILKYLKS